MNKINLYIFKNTSKYILINILIVSILIIFINILEISKLMAYQKTDVYTFLYLILLKIPSIIKQALPFVIIISTAFLFKNLVSNNELISMRNIGFSIIDVFKPIALSVLLFGLITLIFVNPISAFSEKKFHELSSSQTINLYSIKFINKGMWIKNILSEEENNYIMISNIDVEKMKAEGIQILNTKKNASKVIIAKNGYIKDKLIKLNDVTIIGIESDKRTSLKKMELVVNFDKQNIIDSISNYKLIPFYNYYKHIKSLKKFNLYTPEISLYYLSEILKPFFLIALSFAVMGFSGKFKRNENFFNVLFISLLIGFSFFLIQEIILSLTSYLNLSFIFSYFVIFMFPLSVGLYQALKIELD
jgi:lipopolysaccharide export system permease protein